MLKYQVTKVANLPNSNPNPNSANSIASSSCSNFSTSSSSSTKSTLTNASPLSSQSVTCPSPKCQSNMKPLTAGRSKSFHSCSPYSSNSSSTSPSTTLSYSSSMSASSSSSSSASNNTDFICNLGMNHLILIFIIMLFSLYSIGLFILKLLF